MRLMVTASDEPCGDRGGVPGEDAGTGEARKATAASMAATPLHHLCRREGPVRRSGGRPMSGAPPRSGEVPRRLRLVAVALHGVLLIFLRRHRARHCLGG